MITNFTLIRLSLANVNTKSPIFTSGIGNLAIDRSSFSNFLSKLIHSSQIHSAKLSRSTFMNFADKAVDVGHFSCKNKVLIDPINLLDAKHVTIERCRFTKINSKTSAISFDAKNGQIFLDSTSFYNCYSQNSPSSLDLHCHSTSIVFCCFSACNAKQNSNAIYYIKSKQSLFQSNVISGSGESYTTENLMSIYTSKLELIYINTTDILTSSSIYEIQSLGGIDPFNIRLFDIEHCSFKNALKISSASEIHMTQSTFIDLNGTYIIDASLFRVFQITSSDFFKSRVNITRISKPSIDFNNCHFDSTLKLTDLHIDSCKARFTGTRRYKLSPIDVKCWSTVADINNVNRWTFGRIFSTFIVMIVLTVAVLCAIRFVRINFFEDTAERDVLERLNVFEGDENPQIKMMLMDIRDGKPVSKAGENTETDVLKLEVEDENQIAQNV